MCTNTGPRRRSYPIFYRNARRQNALLKDHQLDEPLAPLMMENGGISSIFPETLRDMFSTSGGTVRSPESWRGVHALPYPSKINNETGRDTTVCRLRQNGSRNSTPKMSPHPNLRSMPARRASIHPCRPLPPIHRPPTNHSFQGVLTSRTAAA